MSEAPAGTRYFGVIAGAFVGSLLISNVAAQKLVPFGPFIFTGGILLFPVTYIFGDVLTEVYGYGRARQIIWTGFAANLLFAGFIWLVIRLPAAPGWPLQEQFAAALGLVPRIVAGSILGYWAGEFLNSFVMARMKLASQGKGLWKRALASTALGQAADTVVFGLVAFGGVLPGSVLLTAIWSGYLFKVVYEAVALPVTTYPIVKWLKSAEGVDVFDVNTSFTPFAIRPEPGEARPTRI